ncbi:Imm49 family immunity protein [Streptomyces sp. BB1-1-1]|uniref:Imm49 family immunity protein n=1 Tax=Streptomyces sp. BB1-1-1 TaxID=3074430 RepID=UPI0037D9A972
MAPDGWGARVEARPPTACSVLREPGTGRPAPGPCPVRSFTPPVVRIDALCLSVLRDKAKWHGEAFHFARLKFAEQAQGTPVGELATALTAVVLDDTGDDDEYPPSAQARLAAVDESLDRVRARTEETGEPLLDRPYSAALRTLRALAAEDQHAFDTALSDLLVQACAEAVAFLRKSGVDLAPALEVLSGGLG